MNYVDLHHIYQSLSLLTYIKHNLCWHTSPMGTIRMLYSSMLTCITHVFSIFHEVCWLTSPMDIFELPDLNMSTHINHYLCWHISNIIYADIHHPWVQLEWFIQVCWLASTTYTLDLIKYADLHHPCIY